MNAAIRRTGLILATMTGAFHCSNTVFAGTDYRDTLDRAVSAPDEADASLQHDRLDFFVADALAYDSNLFRLPASITDLTTVVGPNASRKDYSNSASAGLDAQWLVGNRQSIDLDLRVDDNRFHRNDNLNNISSNDRLVWNWGVGGVITGQLGADYNRYLASFVNTDVYRRNVINQSEYFAAARFQLGPRWALFGGLLQANNSLSAAQSTVNNSHRKSVDLGAELATSAANTIGFDYRYTDSRYPNSYILNGISFDPDYREDRARILAKYVVSRHWQLFGRYLARLTAVATDTEDAICSGGMAAIASGSDRGHGLLRFQRGKHLAGLDRVGEGEFIVFSISGRS